MEFLKDLFSYMKNNPNINEWGIYFMVILFLFVYRKLRLGRWREILKRSVDYHKFHLASISKDHSMDEKTRELAQAMLWGVTKQLPTDLENGRGGNALWRSFLGDKTSLNTCGTVYYQCAMNVRSIDRIIIKLNDTLISTFYRIYLLESYLSFLAILYMDFTLIFYIASKPQGGTGRLYLEMLGEIKKSEK
jgi:hypothetical protein